MPKTFVEFGNDKALEGYRDPNSDDPELVRYREAPGQRITTMEIPEDVGLAESFQTVVTAMTYHIAEGEGPTWVESTSPGLQALLEEHFGLSGKNHRNKTWGKDTGAEHFLDLLSVARGTASFMFLCLLWMANKLAFLGTPVAILQALLVTRLAALELRTNGGTDFQAVQMSGSASATAIAGWIGITANATAPAAGDTTLTGEIASGTLTRATATFAHTNGTNTYTLTKTFTSDQSVTIAKLGVFTAVTAGTMVFETLLNASAVLVSGDQLQITETVTL